MSGTEDFKGSIYNVPIVPSPGTKRKADLIEKRLFAETFLLDEKAIELKRLPSNITRKKTQIKALKAKVCDPHGGGTPTDEYKLRMKLTPELKTLEEKLRDVPKQIKDAKDNVVLLKAELAEAKAWEESEKREEVSKVRLTYLNYLRSHLIVVKQDAASILPSKPNKKPDVTPGIFHNNGKPSAKKPVIRRETVLVKVPVNPLKRKGVLLTAGSPAKKQKNDAAGASSSTTAKRSAGLAGTDEQKAAEMAKGQKRKANEISDEEEPKKKLKAGAAAASASVTKGTGGKTAAEAGESKSSDPDQPGGKDDPTTAAGGAVTTPLAKEFSESGHSETRKPNGLINFHNACFSNASIQMLDTALEGHNLDELLGEVDGDLEHFGLIGDEVKDYGGYIDAPVSTRLRRNRQSKRQEVRNRIKAAAKAGRTHSISTAKHLRSLLEDLRKEQDRAHVSPYLFQSVFAWGAMEDVDRGKPGLSERQVLSGDSMEDSSLYFHKVIDALEADPHIGDAAALKAIFNIHSDEVDTCKNCDRTLARRSKDPIDLHNISIPDFEDGEKVELSEVFASSLRSEDDRECPHCPGSKIVMEQTFTNRPDSLVLKLNRTGWDRELDEPYKVQTQVGLGDHKLNVFGTPYELAAVICHNGEDTEFGHYTVFRQCEGEWFFVNDKACERIRPDRVLHNVGQMEQCGESAALLLMKVKVAAAEAGANKAVQRIA